MKVDQSHDSTVTRVEKPTMLTHSMLFQTLWSSLKIHALVFGLPQPAASRGRANTAPTYLRANQNHKIHLKYRETCCENHEKYMEYRSFLDTWHQCLPHIVFMIPRSDECKLCEDHRSSIQEAVTEEEKKKKLA